MAENRRIATVTQLNAFLRALLDNTPVLSDVWVRGEISNIKFHSSGHVYLTLKDEGGALAAVMFRTAAQRLSFRPENGAKVLARGRVSVYERSGTYQLYIEEMEQEGQGELYVKFVELKRRLEAEGLFDQRRKRPLPRFPRVVGICTSPTGAAVRDIINVLRRRWPLCRAVLCPCLVQGEGAAASVAAAIERFNREGLADVLIVGRGGGSIEDLWAFNEELTARAVAASEIPVISAVGHETDFTICDFAADFRAPTPSAAAELAVPDAAACAERVAQLTQGLKTRLGQKAANSRRQLELLMNRAGITGFRRRLGEMQMNVDSLSARGEQAIRRRLRDGRQSLAMCARGEQAMLRRLRDAGHALASCAGRLNALSPLGVLERGYSVAVSDGKAVRRLGDVSVGSELWTTLADGKIRSVVTDKIDEGKDNI